MIPIKDQNGIEAMRISGRAVGETLEALSKLIQPGVSTGEIDQAAAEFIIEKGGTSAFLGYRGFPGHVCISVNEEIVHGIGGKRRLQYGDIVKIDVGIIIDGWVGDSAMTFAVGAPHADSQRLMDTTRDALWNGIRKAIAGRRLGDVSHAIEKTIVDAGMGVVREFVGHGVGRKLHEEPQIPNYGSKGTGPKMKPGMILAIEPMVNLGSAEIKMMSDGWTVVAADGKPSCHMEHTVLITDDLPEILTPRPSLEIPEGMVASPAPII
ncbi:MAG: type I methionyl aminopeptidase [Verrucomicrobiota bacterium]